MKFSFFDLCTRVAQGAIIGMALFITADVILRFLFNSPIFFSADVAGYLLLVMSFLGLAYAERKGAHVRFDTVVKLLPQKIQACFSKVVWVVEIGWAVVVTVCAYMILKDFHGTQQRSLSTGWLIYPFAIFMVVGSILLVLELAGEHRGLLPRFRHQKTAKDEKG